eukprot:1159553-Pelagomonas_calceolata.AAC.2
MITSSTGWISAALGLSLHGGSSEVQGLLSYLFDPLSEPFPPTCANACAQMSMELLFSDGGFTISPLLPALPWSPLHCCGHGQLHFSCCWELDHEPFNYSLFHDPFRSSRCHGHGKLHFPASGSFAVSPFVACFAVSTSLYLRCHGRKELLLSASVFAMSLVICDTLHIQIARGTASCYPAHLSRYPAHVSCCPAHLAGGAAAPVGWQDNSGQGCPAAVPSHGGVSVAYFLTWIDI